MTVAELIEAIDREAERALVGYPLDLGIEIDVAYTARVRSSRGGGGYEEVTRTGKLTRLERIGARVILHLNE